MSGRGWVCEAYGPGPAEEQCFFEVAPSPCEDRGQCKARLAAERVRLYGRLKDMEAGGDAEAAAIAGEVLREVQGPGDLLGGPGEHVMEPGEVALVLRQAPALAALWDSMGIRFRRAVRGGKPVVESYDQGAGPSAVTAWFPLDEAGEWTGMQVVDPPLKAPPPLGLRAAANVRRGDRFVCPRCGAASSHPVDQAMGYCGACHDFT